MQSEKLNSLINEVHLSTARSSGPGGQHVNKTETKVILKWNPFDSVLLNDEEKDYLKEKWSTKLDSNGFITLTSSKFRSQLKNKEDVIEKLKSLIVKSLEKPKDRKPTKTPKSVIAKRKKDKKVNAERKETRKRIDPKNLMVILMVSLSSINFAQLKAPRLYSEVIWMPKKDSLLSEVGKNKVFIPKFELASLVALMHYPELRETKIIFEEKSLKSTMAARPMGLQVLRSKGKRTYVIYINTTESVKVPVDSVSFNAKVGVIGHELAHILDYESKSSLTVIGNGLAYSNKKFRSKFERATDQRTIDHGLGWQCFDWSFYVYHYKNTPSDYLEYKKKTYMSYEEIEEQMKD